jgi:integrase
MVQRGLPCDLADAEESDIRDFVNRLHRDEFTKTNGDPYSGSSKSDAKKFLKQFFKWKDGDRGRYPDKVAWIRTKISKDEQPEEKRVLTLKETHKLAQAMPDAEHKAIVYILFDSGFRISELLSVKVRDFELDEYEDGEEAYWIRCRDSKTYNRKIPLPLFTKELNEFTSSGYYQARDAEDKLVSKTYDAIRMMLKRKSKDVLGEGVTPHNFRHSSATYYARELGDHYAMCDRYGWSYNSDVPKQYIRRSGKRQRDTAQKVAQNKVQETQQRVEELEEENTRIKQQVDELRELVDEVVRKK